mmetsp:Transcript_11448/g.27361  ORF Transcript_11448/g.27361 Transcript_11448/m.27361 type:complete len:214 (+) Transcript_11448:424-1065(+)
MGLHLRRPVRIRFHRCLQKRPCVVSSPRMVLHHRRLSGGHGVADGQHLRRHRHGNYRSGRRQSDAAGRGGCGWFLCGRRAHRLRLVLHPFRSGLIGSQHRHRVLRRGTGRVPIEPSAAVAANDPGVEGRLSDRIPILRKQERKQSVEDDFFEQQYSIRSTRRTDVSFDLSVRPSVATAFQRALPRCRKRVSERNACNEAHLNEKAMRNFLLGD